jgi:hypothetical protein
LSFSRSGQRTQVEINSPVVSMTRGAGKSPVDRACGWGLNQGNGVKMSLVK